MSNLQRAVLPGSDDREDEDTIEMQLSPAQYEVLVRAAGLAERDSAGPEGAGPALTLAAAPAPAAAVTVAAPVASELASVAIKQAIAAIDPVAVSREPPLLAMQAPRPIEVSVHALPAVHAPAGNKRSSLVYVLATGGVILLVLSVTIAYQLGARTRPGDASPSVAPAQITAPVKDARPPPTAPAIQSDPTIPPPPAIIEDAADRPVRFRNPFDANEVFEFPPGTSYTQARDAVAATLLKRAQERRTAVPRAKADDPSFAQRT